MSRNENRLVHGAQEHAFHTHLLDREIPEDYFRERTLHVAAERKRVEVGTKSVTVFRVGTEWLALPTEVLKEVDNHCPAHTVPHHRGGILNGLVNVRGELLLSISLGALLQLERAVDRGKAAKSVCGGRLLICGRDNSRVAFPVDEVDGVRRYHPKDLRDNPATLAKAQTGIYIVGVLPSADRTVGCIDDELLFYAIDKGLA